MKDEFQTEFDFTLPYGYEWLVEHNLVGFTPFGPLQPWYYLDKHSVFSVTDIWPNGSSKLKLIAFARRQDNDDLACFEIDEKEVCSIVSVHGWTPKGYDIIFRYGSFWEWLKSVVDDIAEWAGGAE